MLGNIHLILRLIFLIVIVVCVCVGCLFAFLPFERDFPVESDSVGVSSGLENLAVDSELSGFRAGLFKAASVVANKTIADKTVEKIKSKLKLQCVINLSGQRTAYIKIKDLGMKKCTVGDSVEDMFSVLDVFKDSVEVLIAGSKVTLVK